MIINEMKFFLLSAAVTLLFIIQSFHIEGFGAVKDVPQDLDYGIKFHYPDTWKYLPKYDIDTTDDLSTTSFTIIHNSSIINDIGKSSNGYLITIKVIDDIPLPTTTTAKQWARTALTDISEQPNKYKLIEPVTPNGEFKTLPISQGKYNGYTFTIDDKTTQKIKVKSVLVLDNKRYEFDYTSSNINNEVAYRYIDDYKEILNSIKFY